MSDQTPLDRDPMHGDVRDRNQSNDLGAAQSSMHTDIPPVHTDVKLPHTDLNAGFHTDVPGAHTDANVVPHVDQQVPTGAGETQTP